MRLEPRQVLAADGTVIDGREPDVSRMVARYAAMTEARLYDRKASALQRQGRLATYAPYEGQEASQVGAVAPLAEEDWLVASYRDAAAMRFHGYPWQNLLLTRMGDERGGHPPEGVNVTPPSITVGGHMIHAVGIAWAEKIKGTGAVALTMFGDGATSEGDFHEAMNFAGVYGTPTVFFCQNNGWAISMPRSRQTASATIAQKAEAYGLPGVLVDGNDVLAVEEVVAEAVDRARAGEGATLIEALTYRVRGHTTADDDRRYRAREDAAGWLGKDPLERVRLWLERQGAWDEDVQSGLESQASGLIEAALAEAEAVVSFSAGEIFDAMYEEPTGPLETQRRRAERSTRWA
ncbi:MAG: pyruvate dehydrogenase (acetyl-transferring) E1 component subunit alpha [bacterium]|nr:pyruvate dehydrogenase (acetyl-transferring) E1 component subunit alpha [bacterium]